MSSVSSTSSSTSTTSTSTTTSSTTDYDDFDTASLVEAKLESRYNRIDSMSSEVTANETKIAAYEDLQGMLQDLTDNLTALRGDPSSTGKSSDVFRDRTAYLTSSTSTSASTYMSATVEEGTDLDTHTITITQVAKANILGSSTQDSRYTALGVSGTFTLGTSTGSASITVDEDMSLGDIADAINAEQSTSGVKASVMKVSDTSYQLVLTSVETGKTITASDTSGTVLTSTLGLLTSSGAIDSSKVLQSAQKAIFSVDGVTITRSSNDIDDVLDGVTLHLYSAPSTDTALTLEVSNDLTAIKDAITALVETYNTLRDFVVTNQTTTSSGTADDSATLYGDSTLRSIASTLQSILSSGTSDTSLAALGITFDDNNKLVVDDSALGNALLDNLDDIQALFSYTMTSSSGDLSLVRHPNAAFDFTLKVEVDSSGALTSASVGGDSSLFTVSGSTIKGATGSIYEGLTLVYTGSTSKSITVNLTQGIADQMYYASDAVGNSDDGTLVSVIKSLNNNNDTLNDKIDTLTSSTQTYANYLYNLYANMASKISEAETTVKLLKALLNASTD